MNDSIMINESKYPKIAVVGDLHLNHTTPKSRIDDFPSTTIDKLESLRLLLVNNGINYLIFLGDIFHKPSQSIPYLNRLIAKFNDFKNSGINIYSIIGNHDISFDRLDTLLNSSLNILYSTVFNHQQTLSIPYLNSNVVFNLVDFYNPITKQLDPTNINILCAHMFYNSSLTDLDNITPEQVKSLGYNYMFLGHDHVPYPVEEVVSSKSITYIYRPGSFMRGTSHHYNLTRDVYTDVVSLDPKGIRVDRLVVPTKPASEVFTFQSLNETKSMLDTLLKSKVTTLISEIYNTTDSNMSIYDLLNSTDIPSSVRNTIVRYLKLHHVYDKGELNV